MKKGSIRGLLCSLCLFGMGVSCPVFAGTFDNQAAKKELPDGPGLAAAYVADVDIGKDREVIFADDFETGDFGKGWDEIGNPKGKVLSIVDPGKAELGHRSLRVEAHLESDTGGGMTR